MLIEMIVFAVTLVAAQFIGGLIMMKFMMKHFMNKEAIKKYSKMSIEVANELAVEMLEEEEESN